MLEDIKETTESNVSLIQGNTTYFTSFAAIFGFHVNQLPKFIFNSNNHILKALVRYYIEADQAIVEAS